MPRTARRYTAKLKFQVVLEALKGEKTPGQIAKAYGVHANSVGIWKNWFLERGPAVLERAETARDGEKRMAELEQLLGKKEVEIALLKNFLGRTA
jgi:transposase-like protein